MRLIRVCFLEFLQSLVRAASHRRSRYSPSLPLAPSSLPLMSLSRCLTLITHSRTHTHTHTQRLSRTDTCSPALGTALLLINNTAAAAAAAADAAAAAAVDGGGGVTAAAAAAARSMLYQIIAEHSDRHGNQG